MLSGSYSKRPTIELWGRALRWQERLRALATLPLYDDDFDFAVAWDVSDHAFALLGCCDAMRDWLLKSRPRLKVAVRALYASENLRKCRDLVNTYKHLRLMLDPKRRYYAATPLTRRQVRAIGKKRHARGETTMLPEEFLTITEPLVFVLGKPGRLIVAFPGKNQSPTALVDLCEACVEEIGAFLKKRRLLPAHEGERRSYGYPRAPKPA
jgi:hypothetical protein